jgi:hypothetical protein
MWSLLPVIVSVALLTTSTVPLEAVRDWVDASKVLVLPVPVMVNCVPEPIKFTVLLFEVTVSEVACGNGIAAADNGLAGIVRAESHFVTGGGQCVGRVF